MNDILGIRMKSYEAVSRSTLMPHSYTILRVDGRAFHTYLRRATKPYDFDFMYDMKEVGKVLCSEVSGTVFAYGQSDEISLLLCDTEPQSEPWFGGVVQKMASVSASIATAALMEQRGTYGRPHFDARVFTVPHAEVPNYFIWRQQDAVRNSISMLAQSKFSQSQLYRKNVNDMQEMLFTEFGINWNDVREDAKRGWVVRKATRMAPVEYVHKGTKEVITETAVRSFWEATEAPHFVYDDGPWWPSKTPSSPQVDDGAEALVS